MAENAKYRGQEVKIGTCEEMYYLRADQARKVQRVSGSVDPVGDRAALRFRFPWPNEDNVEPGGFGDYERAVTVYGVEMPKDVDHGSVQFKAEPGYLVSLPCPESPKIAELPITVHRNGFSGSVRIVQQRYVEGRLVLVAMCGGCRAKWRVPTIEDAEPYIAGCLKRAEEEERRNGSPEWWRKVAERIRDGYDVEKVAKLF